MRHADDGRIHDHERARRSQRLRHASNRSPQIAGVVEAGVADHDIVRRGRQRRLFQVAQEGQKTARLPGSPCRIVPQPRGRKEPSGAQPEVSIGAQIDRQDGVPQRCQPVAEPGEACAEIGDRQRGRPEAP